MVKCDKCGCPMIVDASVILTSYPPKYTAICPSCGNIQYPFTTECFENEKVYNYGEIKEAIKNYKIPKKLVRDKIPEIIRNSGGIPVGGSFENDSEYFEALKDKLLEEAGEFIESEETEELADVLEVIKYIIRYNPDKYGGVLSEMLKKEIERGGFEYRIYLNK